MVFARALALGLIVLGGAFAQTALATPQDQASPGWGEISGIVLDPQGKYPVAGARVEAFYQEPTAGILPQTTSGPDGTFVITQVMPQSLPYWVVAEKVQDGYPDPLDSVYDSRPWEWLPEVKVDPGVTVRDVIVRLYPQVGRLRLHVLEAYTDEPLHGGFYDAVREDNPQIMSGRSSAWKDGVVVVLVPGAPCRVMIGTPGYQTWYYGDDGTKEHARGIKMSPGEIRDLTVNLYREPGPR